MQNCLQTKVAFSRRKLLLTLLLLLILSLCICAVCYFKLSQRTPQKGVAPKYLSAVIGHGAEKDLRQMSENGAFNVKMNNEQQKNAKTHVFPSSPAENTLVLPKTVDVMTSQGEIVTMELEEYVKGCVLGEMPLDFESQAIMAQSVAVRSFTVRLVALGSKKHKNADVCTNPACCQNFISPDSVKLKAENLKKLNDSVTATKGMILTYLGQPIEAVYHASSGDKTLDSEDVWGGRVEYLRSVKAPDGETAISAMGRGHRVGLSQHGANLLAKEGRDFMEILSYYYTGVSFSFV